MNSVVLLSQTLQVRYGRQCDKRMKEEVLGKEDKEGVAYKEEKEEVLGKEDKEEVLGKEDKEEENKGEVHGVEDKQECKGGIQHRMQQQEEVGKEKGQTLMNSVVLLSQTLQVRYGRQCDKRMISVPKEQRECQGLEEDFGPEME